MVGMQVGEEEEAGEVELEADELAPEVSEGGEE